MIRTQEVLVPRSLSEAVDAYGDGDGTLVIAGGTIVMSEINAGRLLPSRALLLHRAGLDKVSIEGGAVRIGAAATLETIGAQTPPPLAMAARSIADLEVGRQATIGGNLAAPFAGDLQAVLLALDATVRHTGPGGERYDPVASYLAAPGRRLVLEISFGVPVASSYVRLDRPHAHSYTVMAVTVVRSNETTRVAVKGASASCSRLLSVERALAAGADPVSAAARALDDVETFDDTLASAWYRRRVLPALVAKALAEALEPGEEAR